MHVLPHRTLHQLIPLFRRSHDTGSSRCRGASGRFAAPALPLELQLTPEPFALVCDANPVAVLESSGELDGVR
jgi:hypothetical protein